MKRLVQTLALGAALAAVAIGVWRDYAPSVVLRQAALAYLAAYFLAGASYLACQAALRGVRDPEPEPVPEPNPRRRNRQRGQRTEATTAPPPADLTKAAAPAPTANVS